MELLTVVMLLLAGTAVAELDMEVDLNQHMKHLYEARYPVQQNEEARASVRDYIGGWMTNYGLDVVRQNFTTTIDADPRGIISEMVEVEGVNVIGIKKAVSQHPGAVVVVGADYDTDGLNEPVFQNGAGVAALLETVRLYGMNSKWSGRYVANYTTIFVAFDINTRLHQRSPGHPGGHFFLYNWLLHYIERNVDHFGGAVIFDSIMNVNYDDNSQTLGSQFENMFPDTYKRVQQSSNQGSFLAMVSAGEAENSRLLKDQFSGNFNKDRRARPYRLEDIQLRTGTAFDYMVQEFSKSESIHFWSFKNDTNVTFTLPAILLTDTKEFRTEPSCVSTPCRPVDLLTQERLEFVEATVKATTNFLFSRQATLLPEPPSSAISSLPSALMTCLMLLLVRLYM